MRVFTLFYILVVVTVRSEDGAALYARACQFHDQIWSNQTEEVK